jgi:serine protease
MVKPTARSYLTVHPHGTPVPGTSNVNAEPQQTVANLVVAQLSSDGQIDVYDAEHGGAYLVDVVGWLRADPA